MSLSPLAFYSSLSAALPFISGLGIADSGPTTSLLAPSDVHSTFSSHSDVGDRREGGSSVGVTPLFPLLSSLASFLPSSPFFSQLSLPSSVPLFWSTFARSSPPPRLQHLLTSQLDSSLFSAHSLEVSGCPVAARAFASVCQPSSGSWLSCLPSSPSLSLSSDEFVFASRLRLFLPPSASLPLLCLCSSPLSDPTHFLSCKRLKDLRRVRHDRIVRFLSSLIQRLGGTCQVEPSHFPTIRPDLLVFLVGCSYILDLVVSHPCSPSRLSLPDGFLTVARYAESRKFSKYSSIISSCTSSFVPFSIETFGALAPEATRFVKRLSALTLTSPSHSIPSPPILPSLSILLQRCNAYILSRGVGLCS